MSEDKNCLTCRHYDTGSNHYPLQCAAPLPACVVQTLERIEEFGCGYDCPGNAAMWATDARDIYARYLEEGRFDNCPAHQRKEEE